ncbi:peptidoglycan recognition protein [Streptomyces cavernae]|uniref:peptidoglycan recognition protein family protein n=1 Tax=Streptomyces cavernae TaxID=2259034 RepID=UPI000FEB7A03|nr:N-acetylmuramoyl-L-alanine amidase [Streptomyces cavernae]
MRRLISSSIGVACTAALALPLAFPSHAAAPDPGIPGSTQSLPLAPLSTDRSPAPAQGLTKRDVRSFSLVGVVWDDPAVELHGQVQVRTRSVATGEWSDWQDLDTHNHAHAADLDSAEGTSRRLRGATAPLWVGESNGIEVRVETAVDSRAGGEEALPRGMRLELVDPGAEPLRGAEGDGPQAAALTPESAAASAVNAELAPLGVDAIPALDKKQTEAELFIAEHGTDDGAEDSTEDGTDDGTKDGTKDSVETSAEDSALRTPYIGPRPRIVTRRGWGADESLRERDFRYTKAVRVAFVHHSGSGNNYSCAQASSVIRSIYRYHVVSSGWRDIGYNFLVDKCGNIYEGRAGGVAKAVMGAHTLGFNNDSMGIAVLGSFSATNPAAKSVDAIARLTAWKLGLYGGNPKGKASLTSGGGNRYKKGTKVRLNVISGHRDGFATDCPGSRLYAKLGTARSKSARYQGR